MNNIDDDRQTTKIFGRLLSAVCNLGEDLHGQGIIDLEQLRLSVPARRIEAKRLVEVEKKSKRQVARELGVSEGTIRADLNGDGAQKMRKSAQKLRNEESEQIPDCSEERWQQSLKGFSFDASRLREYWNKEFPGWEMYAASDEFLDLVKRAISEWSEIETIIEDKLKWVR